MIDLLSYISEDNIVELDSYKSDVIAKNLIRVSLNDFSEEEQKKVFAEIKSLRKKKRINLTKGFAMFHLRLANLDRIRLAIGIPPQPVKESKHGEIYAIFSIFVPEAKCRKYLSLMAHLARLLSQPNAKHIFRPGNKKQIIEFVKQFEKA